MLTTSSAREGGWGGLGGKQVGMKGLGSSTPVWQPTTLSLADRLLSYLFLFGLFPLDFDKLNFLPVSSSLAKAHLQLVVYCSLCLFSFPFSLILVVSQCWLSFYRRPVSVKLCWLQLCQQSTGCYWCVYWCRLTWCVSPCRALHQNRWSFTISWSWCHLSMYLNVFVLLVLVWSESIVILMVHTLAEWSQVCCRRKSFFMHKHRLQKLCAAAAPTNTQHAQYTHSA